MIVELCILWMTGLKMTDRIVEEEIKSFPASASIDLAATSGSGPCIISQSPGPFDSLNKC